MPMLAAALLSGGALLAAAAALRRWARGGVCTATVDLLGKTAIVTGANTGIGKETAAALARMGASVICACRDPSRMQEAIDDIKKQTGNVRVEGARLDLADLQSIRTFSEQLHERVEKIDILVNNAGVFMDKRTVTKDGFETTFGVNHLGHFLLTVLLLDLLKKGAPARVVAVSSLGNTFVKDMDMDDLMFEKRKFSVFDVYGQSKLANILFTNELFRRYNGLGLTANSVHPGLVSTEIDRGVSGPMKYAWTLFKYLGCLYSKSPREGAQTSIYAAIAPELEGIGGKYFTDCAEVSGPRHINPLTADVALAQRLWAVSERLVGETAPDASSL